MEVSNDNKYVIVFVGKELVKQNELLMQMIVLEQVKELDYEILKVIDIEE